MGVYYEYCKDCHECSPSEYFSSVCFQCEESLGPCDDCIRDRNSVKISESETFNYCDDCLKQEPSKNDIFYSALMKHRLLYEDRFMTDSEKYLNRSLLLYEQAVRINDSVNENNHLKIVELKMLLSQCPNNQ